MPIAWNGLTMPTEGCSVCMAIVIINFKVRVLDRTLPHTGWRLYLPTFLLNVGLLILMNIDSFIVLARPWSSLPMILKLSGVVLCPVWVLCMWICESSFRCSLNLSPKVLEVSPIYSSSHVSPHSGSNI